MSHWRGKLTDEESKSPGERARPRVPSGAPRARHVENATGLRPHFFQLSPRGRVLVHPRAGALPETRALPRFLLPHRSPKVGADRRDARSFRRAAPFRGVPQSRWDAEVKRNTCQPGQVRGRLQKAARRVRRLGTSESKRMNFYEWGKNTNAYPPWLLFVCIRVIRGQGRLCR